MRWVTLVTLYVSVTEFVCEWMNEWLSEWVNELKVFYRAQHHSEHYTLHTVEQLEALYMHNHDYKRFKAGSVVDLGC